MEIEQKIIPLLKGYPDIVLCILFGSLAEQKQTPSSDLDIAIAGKNPFDARLKYDLIEELAFALGRPVDLIDLQVTSGTLLHQILTKGTLLYCRDHSLYAIIIKRMLFNQSDMMPYHLRILNERRARWINK